MCIIFVPMSTTFCNYCRFHLLKIFTKYLNYIDIGYIYSLQHLNINCKFYSTIFYDDSGQCRKNTLECKCYLTKTHSYNITVIGKVNTIGRVWNNEEFHERSTSLIIKFKSTFCRVKHDPNSFWQTNKTHFTFHTVRKLCHL